MCKSERKVVLRKEGLVTDSQYHCVVNLKETSNQECETGVHTNIFSAVLTIPKGQKFLLTVLCRQVTMSMSHITQLILAWGSAFIAWTSQEEAANPSIVVACHLTNVLAISVSLEHRQECLIWDNGMLVLPKLQLQSCAIPSRPLHALWCSFSCEFFHEGWYRPVWIWYKLIMTV